MKKWLIWITTFSIKGIDIKKFTAFLLFCRIVLTQVQMKMFAQMLLRHQQMPKKSDQNRFLWFGSYGTPSICAHNFSLHFLRRWCRKEYNPWIWIKIWWSPHRPHLMPDSAPPTDFCFFHHGSDLWTSVLTMKINKNAFIVDLLRVYNDQ